MRAIEPPPELGELVIAAKDQPQYNPLPVRVGYDPIYGSTTVISEWELSAEDLALVNDGGRLRLTVLTFGQPLQPIRIEVVEEVVK